MIGGTLVIEDCVIQFNVQHNNDVIYTVSDNLSGESEIKLVDGKGFMYALSLALMFDGEFPDCNIQEAWELAHSVQPDNKKLRFIP